MSKDFPDGFRKRPPKKMRAPVPPPGYALESEKEDYRRSRQRQFDQEIIEEALGSEEIKPICPICGCGVREEDFDRHVLDCAEKE